LEICGEVRMNEVYIDECDKGTIIIDGKKYVPIKTTTKKIDGITHLNKTIFKPFNEEKFNEDIETIVKKIKNSTSVEEILKEILKSMPLKQLREAANRIRKGEKPKKQHGCFGFKIGNKYLALVD
jgi:hypothetical protein